MTDESSSTPKPLVKGYEPVLTAPIVYFDYVSAYGTLSGTIQIELAARSLAPLQDGGVDIRTIEVAHLRCSRAAATYLRDILDKALQMLNQPQGGTPVSAARLN